METKSNQKPKVPFTLNEPKGSKFNLVFMCLLSTTPLYKTQAYTNEYAHVKTIY